MAEAHRRKPLSAASNPDIPSSVDWRTKDGVIRPVMNMGQFEDSKSIAVVRSIEAMRAIANKDPFSLSFVEVENCCRDSSTNVYQCIVDMGGLAADERYPRNSTVCLSKSIQAVATIRGGVFVPNRYETGMAEAVVKQPIVVGLDASMVSFQLYQSGVYRDYQCSLYARGRVCNLDGMDYWLCQNTWGKLLCVFTQLPHI